MRDTLSQERLAVSVEEAGQRLGIGRSLAFKLAAEGKLPTIRLGKRLVVPVAALAKMLEGRDAVPVAPEGR